jgi:hypothetical protein
MTKLASFFIGKTAADVVDLLVCPSSRVQDALLKFN